MRGNGHGNTGLHEHTAEQLDFVHELEQRAGRGTVVVQVEWGERLLCPVGLVLTQNSLPALLPRRQADDASCSFHRLTGGVGKTTLGLIAATSLRRAFIDADSAFQTLHGSISTYVASTCTLTFIPVRCNHL